MDQHKYDKNKTGSYSTCVFIHIKEIYEWPKRFERSIFLYTFCGGETIISPFDSYILNFILQNYFGVNQDLHNEMSHFKF